jgi:hypothetical protein
MILGAITMLQASDDPVPEVSVEPIFLSAEFIDHGIGTGALKAGQFNDLNVAPPVNQWPPAWRFLKER